jgi:flagellar protein FliT
MTGSEVISMYEHIAGLSHQMVAAARSSDWADLTRLERQCAAVHDGALGTIAPLAGAARLRKIELLKQILANDREIRNSTQPWIKQLSNIMQAPRREQ